MEKTKARKYILMICEGAACIALAQILGYLKLWRMPWGGSITLLMLPMFIYSIRWGVKSGLIAGFALGVLQFLLDGGISIGWQAIIGDYLAAFTLLGLAGLFSGKRGGIFAGAAVGALGRFAAHYITGATLWAEYMPDKFFGMTMTSPWFYSLLYNGFYIVLSLAICMAVIGALYVPLKKFFAKQN